MVANTYARARAHTHTHTHTHVARNAGSAWACSWDTRTHMRRDRMRVCARERVPVACDRALVRACVRVCVSVSGCLCIGVCRGGGWGQGVPRTRTQMHTVAHLDLRACAHMMTDLALLAWPPQEPLSVRQSAEHPAGGGLQRADEPYVSRGREGGWSQREKGKGRGSTFTRTHSRTHIHTRKRTHSRTHMHTHMCARGAEGRQ